MAQALLKRKHGLDPTMMLFLQSISAERQLNEHQTWYDFRIPEVLDSMHHVSRIQDKHDLAFVERYVKDRIHHYGKGKQEDKALQLSINHGHPRVIIATVAIAELYNQSLAPTVTHCIIDEAGLVPENQLISLVASLPKLQQLFLTGDRFQLPAYHLGVPDSIFQRGFESILDVITRRRIIPELEFTHSYRAHPKLTQYLSAAVYSGKIIPAVTADDRSFLTVSTFPLPIVGIPLTLIHTSSPDHTTFTKSRSNDQQEQIALLLCEALSKALPKTASIAVLSFYLGTVKSLKLRLQGTSCAVHSVDSFQVKEADVIILVTTRSSTHNDLDLEFFLDPQRLALALSRARHGLFIIASFSLLQRSNLWCRYISAATQDTPIMSTDYIAVIQAKIMLDSRGIIQAPDGRIAIARTHFTYNQKWS